ncbi:MAG: TIM-barrel domain-containing protein [Chloroflexota bacterium]
MDNAVQPFLNRIRIQGNPVAHPDSMVVCGQARFTMLTSRLIRMEWAADGHFVDQATFAFPTRSAEVPTFSCEQQAAGVEIKTEFLTLVYAEDGKSLNSSNLSISFLLDGQPVTWTPGMANPGNLRGTRRTLDQCAGEASLDEGLLSRAGWSLFDDSASVMWDHEQIWVEARPELHIQDWYFFGYGHNYKTLLHEYTQFGGDIPLIPRYVLGAWWSRFWAYHADDLKRLVNDFSAHDVPLDVLVVDMDWHTPDGWTGYTWNRALFPDPEAFLAWVHEQHLYATLNLHPADGILKHEAAYPEFAQRMGIDPASSKPVAFNAADKQFIQHYFELLHHPMEAQGIDFWWIDWQQGNSAEIKNLDPLPWLNHLHFRDSTRRGTRPMLYSRWGGLGNHRYPIGFSGDAYTTWDALAFQPYFTATAANVGYGWWSHDIGGHFGAADPELYARWVQFGAVSPCLRLHSTKDPLAERRPWAFPDDVYQAAKTAIQFRYQLLPYLYSAARNLSQQGLSLCYPMYYDYPGSEDAYLARDQYFLGDQLIAAPIVRPADPETGLAAIDVWLPEGTWFEFTTLEKFVGPRWVRLYGDLNSIPLFAKAGAMVPMAAHLMRTKDWDGAHTILNIFPGADGQFELYEDDGTTEAYQNGQFATTCIRVSARDAKIFTISIGAAEGQFSTTQKRSFEICLRGMQRPSQVLLNGKESRDWTHNPETHDLAISVQDMSRSAPFEITVQGDGVLAAGENSTLILSDVTKLAALNQQPASREQAAEIILGAAEISKAAVARLGGPFAHFIEYATFEDARQQFGTLVIAVPADGSAYDAEISWALHKNGVVTKSEPVSLKNCHTGQIVHSPFADDGNFTTSQWTAVVNLSWRGRTISYHHESQVIYPSLTQWHTLIYNPEQEPHSISDGVSADGAVNSELDWKPAPQTAKNSLNLKQPYGVVLLEAERQRIVDGEVLEACVATSITSQNAQDAVLDVQHVGEATCFLNGVELTVTEPIAHAKLDPMFYSWMPPKQGYFSLPLRQGENSLVIITRPDKAIGWWGVGATVFDGGGHVLI